MFNFIRSIRERGWVRISFAEYQNAWQQLGGSVATHPDVVRQLSDLSGIAVDYLGFYHDDSLQAAMPVWGAHIALSKEVLKKQKKRHFFDLGNAEIILPQCVNAPIPLRHRVRYLSELNSAAFQGIKPQKEGLALARKPQDYSRKFRYNQRRELRLLEEAGGKLLPVDTLSAQEQATIYSTLFEKRWGFATPAKAYLPQVLEIMRPFITGSFITINDEPAAYQVLYRVQSPAWVSVEYINGGVDPAFNEFSPGSVLSFVNTQNEWQAARELDKDLRYSFGRADREYKDRWCERVAVYSV